MTTKNPALVLFIENKAIIESIANDAEVNPVRMRNVFLFNLWNEDEIADDWDDETEGRNPRVIDDRNPRKIAFMNSFFSIFGNSIIC